MEVKYQPQRFIKQIVSKHIVMILCLLALIIVVLVYCVLTIVMILINIILVMSDIDYGRCYLIYVATLYIELDLIYFLRACRC